MSHLETLSADTALGVDDADVGLVQIAAMLETIARREATISKLLELLAVHIPDQTALANEQICLCHLMASGPGEAH
ncbi:MAG: hypothetical protein AAF317_07315 [Pseudomonadota bacterium]